MITLPKTIVAALAAVLLTNVVLPSAEAIPINGTINFSGTAIGTQSGGMSTLTFNNPMIVTSRTGDYAGVPLGTAANWAPISWTGSGFDAVLTPGPQLEWQFTTAGTTYKLTLFSITNAVMSSSMLTLQASGIATINGAFNRDPTNYTLFIQGTGSNFAFQIGELVPESGSAITLLALATTALGGLRMLRRLEQLR